MAQYIIVFVIIAATLTYVVFSIVKNLRTKNESHCGGCTGCSIKNEMKSKDCC